jgi:hypothetical protein
LHSVGQLTQHIVYWNRQNLARFKGETVPQLSTNDETFTKFDKAHWSDLVRQLDEGMKSLEQVVETASDEQLQKWAPTIARIGTHNAYHTGQIIVVRKLQGSWNPESGVK